MGAARSKQSRNVTFSSLERLLIYWENEIKPWEKKFLKNEITYEKFSGK